MAGGQIEGQLSDIDPCPKVPTPEHPSLIPTPSRLSLAKRGIQRTSFGKPDILFHPGGSEPPGLVVAASGSGARMRPS